MKKILAITWVVFVAGFLPIAPDTLAQELPDGATPANEGVCDPLKSEGVTKGLYGLCVAYCEAQDMDAYPDKRPERIVEKVPNSKILRNYNKKKDDSDPLMPCISDPCPCFDSELISEFGDRAISGSPEFFCQVEGVNSAGTDQSFINESYESGGQTPFEDFFATVIQYDAGPEEYHGQQFCRYADNVANKDISLQVDVNEYESCKALIVDACTRLGRLP